MKRRPVILTLLILVMLGGAYGVWRATPAQDALLSRLDVSALSQRAASSPDDWRTLYWYGKRLAEAGNLPQAETALRTSLGLQPDYLPALGELGKVLFTEGRTEEAFQVLRMVTGRDPNNVEARITLAALYQLQGAPQRAVDELNVALKLQPRNAAALYQLGACQAIMQQPGNAEATFRLALREAPEDPRVLIGLSRVLRGTGKLDEAEALARKALQLDAENVDGLVALAQVLSIAQPVAKNREEALGLLQRARGLEANRLDIPQTAAQMLTASGRWREAIPELREAIRIAPDSTQAYFLLARAYRQVGQLRESRQAEALFRKFGDYQRQVRLLGDRIAAEPDNAALRFAVAEEHAKARYLDRAIEAYKRGLERDPNNADAKKRLSELLKFAAQP